MNISELLSLPELRKDLLRVDDDLRRAVSSDDPFLTEVAAHLITAGGKRLRPTMAIAAALTSVPGPVPNAVIQGAAAVELVHIGSLYHDDVLDEATSRRSVPSVNAKYGNFMAIISGDYLLAKCSGLAASLGPEIAQLMADTIAELCQGQVREFQYAYRVDRSVEAYESCIAGKTASLIAASAQVGALTAGLSSAQVEALTTFGYGFGMAFQIRDDILDIVGTDEQLGKPAGNDLVEGVYTLPVIYALEENANNGRLNEILGDKIDLAQRDEARDIVRSSNGVQRALQSGRAWAQQSVDAIGQLPDSEMTRHLRALAENIFSEFDSASS